MVVAIVAKMDWEVVQLDVKTAFLYADIDREVFAQAAPGFERTDKDGGQLLLKLGKSLYRRLRAPGTGGRRSTSSSSRFNLFHSSLSPASAFTRRTAS